MNTVLDKYTEGSYITVCKKDFKNKIEKLNYKHFVISSILQLRELLTSYNINI